MRKVSEKEYPVPFHNDVFFKYMLIGIIIEEIYCLKVQ